MLGSTSLYSLAEDSVPYNQPYIIGHWNYPDNSVNPIYVVSDSENVELFINGISNGFGRHENKYLFTFDNVIFEPGTITAVSYDTEGKELGKYSLVTSGIPAQIKLTVLKPGEANYNGNSDETVILCEITDFYGRRCLQDNRTVFFEIEEPAEMINASVPLKENNVRYKQISLHNGENQISVKKPSSSGEIKITAKTTGLAPAVVSLGNS